MKITGKKEKYFLWKRQCKCQYLWTGELHGITKLISCVTWIGRCFWFGVIITCFFFTFDNMSKVIKNYSEMQTTTSLTIHQMTSLKFPSFTICPRNPDAIKVNELTAEIRKSLPTIKEFTAVRLLSFLIAGYGFSSMENEVISMGQKEIELLSSLFDRWRENASLYQMFQHIFNHSGIQCHEAFLTCQDGYGLVDCCELFKPTYVILRGRCFKLNEFYQMASEEASKLTVILKDIPSPIAEPGGYQLQLVLYVAPDYQYVSFHPRYYINNNEWSRVRFRLREIHFLSSNKLCSAGKNINQSRVRCLMERWLEGAILNPFNCTLAYLPISNIPICHPKVIIRHYKNLNFKQSNTDRCNPECVRQDIIVQKHSSLFMSTGKNDTRKFVIEASYAEMEYEKYVEIPQTSWSAFISQIGGQCGLFLGASVITFLQLIYSVFRVIYRRIQKALTNH